MTETVSLDTHDGFHVTSNSQTADQLKEQFKDPKAVEAPKEPAKADPEPVEATDQAEEGQEAEKAGEQPEKPLGKPKNDPRARVMQATRQAAEAKRERDEIERRAIAAEAELERYRSGKPATEPAKSETKPAAPADGADPEPKEDDFESYGQYVKAQARWEARQEFREQTTAHEQRQQRELAVQHQREMFEAFKGRIQTAIKADPTINEHISPDVVALIPNGPVDLSKRLTNEELIGVHCVAEEKGLDMMRHLSDNPDVLQRLRGLSQGSLLVELGRIDARLGSASTAPEPKATISRANPPVRPVTAVAPSGDTDDVDPNLSFDEWAKATERKRLRELKAQRG